MNETQQKLLDEKHVIILPEDIDHSVYEYVLEACLLHPDPIKMYCRGDGGCSRSALAIVDVMRQHGHVIGLLAGEANSSSAIIWAGTSERYVFPFGVMGIHKLASVDHGIMDSQYAQMIADEYKTAERSWAQILAAASNHSESYWYEEIQAIGSRGLKQYRASALTTAMGMAKPISALADA